MQAGQLDSKEVVDEAKAKQAETESKMQTLKQQEDQIINRAHEAEGMPEGSKKEQAKSSRWWQKIGAFGGFANTHKRED